MNTDLVHIASFIVQHHDSAAPALDVAIAALPGAELVARANGRSVVLCEAGSDRGIADGIEQLRDVAGVMSVQLVYHHAEPEAALAEELTDADPS